MHIPVRLLFLINHFVGTLVSTNFNKIYSLSCETFLVTLYSLYVLLVICTDSETVQAAVHV